MERIYYDTYENRIRVTIWAQSHKDGSVEIHKYTRGVYIDDIFGMDEDEIYMIIENNMISRAMNESHTNTVKDLLSYFDLLAKSRDGYDKIRAWLENNRICFAEETV